MRDGITTISSDPKVVWAIWPSKSPSTPAPLWSHRCGGLNARDTRVPPVRMRWWSAKTPIRERQASPGSSGTFLGLPQYYKVSAMTPTVANSSPHYRHATANPKHEKASVSIDGHAPFRLILS